MRKVFLDNLPKRGKGINWISSLGNEVRFKYDNVIGSVSIVDYNKYKQELHILYKNDLFAIHTSDFQKAKLGGHILGIHRQIKKVS